MRSGLVVLKQPLSFQTIKDALRLLRLHAQLECDNVDRRQDAAICRRQTPQVNQRLEQRWFEPLYLRIIDKFLVDAKPVGHGATPCPARTPAMSGVTLSEVGVVASVSAVYWCRFGVSLSPPSLRRKAMALTFGMR